MSELVRTLRAIVRDELSRFRHPALGVVTEVFARDADGSANNHQVNVALRDSGVELQRVPVAAARLGLSALPHVDDLVLVSFVNGDLNAPIVVGSVYDDTARPPVGKPDEIVYEPPDDEASGVRRLHLALPGGNVLTIDDETLSIEMGGTTVEIKKDGDVTVKGAGKITLESSGDLSIKSQGAVEIEAQTDVKVKAGIGATLEGGAEAKVKGASISLAGMTQFSAS